MKNLFYILSVAICLIMFNSCDKDDNNGNDDTGNTNKIRYEALISDTINYQLRISYMDETGSPLKSHTSQGNWSYEMEGLEVGTYLYISALAIPLFDETPEKTITVKILLDNNVLVEDSGNTNAICQHTLE